MKKLSWIILAIIGFQLIPKQASAGSLSYLGQNHLPRGMRNNNPGNIEKTPAGLQRWLGEIDSMDSRFAQFEAYKYGVRAMLKLLNNYMTNYNLRTVRGIINRYAPPSDNPGGGTANYINQVSSALNVNPDTLLSITPNNLKKLVVTMSRHENGMEAVTFEYANQVWNEFFG